VVITEARHNKCEEYL